MGTYVVESAEEGSIEARELLAAGWEPFAVTVTPTLEEIERYDRHLDENVATGDYRTVGHVTTIWFRVRK